MRPYPPFYENIIKWLEWNLLFNGSQKSTDTKVTLIVISGEMICMNITIN